MRRLERMVAAHEGKHKDLVKFIAGQTCLDPHTIRQLVRSFELKAKMSVTGRLTEEVQPTVLIEALAAPNPEELVMQAIEEDWTADQTRKAFAHYRLLGFSAAGYRSSLSSSSIW